MLALIAGAAAEVDVAPGAHAVPADVDVLFEHDHRSPVIEGGDGGREPRGAGADGDEVRRQVPEVLGLGVPGSDPGQRGRADPRGGAAPDEGAPADARVAACRFAHWYPPRPVRPLYRDRGGRARPGPGGRRQAPVVGLWFACSLEAAPWPGNRRRRLRLPPNQPARSPRRPGGIFAPRLWRSAVEARGRTEPGGGADGLRRKFDVLLVRFSHRARRGRRWAVGARAARRDEKPIGHG